VYLTVCVRGVCLLCVCVCVWCVCVWGVCVCVCGGGELKCIDVVLGKGELHAIGHKIVVIKPLAVTR